jgi:ketosteroid isomerase-like protein
MTLVETEALVGRVGRFLDELERGDVDAAIEVVESLIHPEMEFTSLIGSEVEGRTYVGVAGLREWFGDFCETFEIRYDNRLISVPREGVVLGLYTNTLRGKESRIEMSNDIGTVWELEDGQIVRAVTYPSQDEARSAAGVRGETK